MNTLWQDNYIPEPNSGCWLWLGRLTQKGYGQVVLNGYHHTAHRFFYEMHVGPIPDGMLACHRCDQPSCVNPDHIFIGTSFDNNRDTVMKGRHRPRCGEKLTRDQVDAIKNAPRADGVVNQLAGKYGVSHSLISMIRSGKRWRR